MSWYGEPLQETDEGVERWWDVTADMMGGWLGGATASLVLHMDGQSSRRAGADGCCKGVEGSRDKEGEQWTGCSRWQSGRFLQYGVCCTAGGRAR